jgi:hypothetical protein
MQEHAHAAFTNLLELRYHSTPAETQQQNERESRQTTKLRFAAPVPFGDYFTALNRHRGPWRSGEMWSFRATVRVKFGSAMLKPRLGGEYFPIECGKNHPYLKHGFALDSPVIMGINRPIFLALNPISLGYALIITQRVSHRPKKSCRQHESRLAQNRSDAAR